jgi:hypothetical protein
LCCAPVRIRNYDELCPRAYRYKRMFRICRGRAVAFAQGHPDGARGSNTPVPRATLFIFGGSVAGGTYPTAPFVKEALSSCSTIVCRLLPPSTSLRDTKGREKEISGLNSRTIPVAAIV